MERAKPLSIRYYSDLEVWHHRILPRSTAPRKMDSGATRNLLRNVILWKAIFFFNFLYKCGCHQCFILEPIPMWSGGRIGPPGHIGMAPNIYGPPDVISSRLDIDVIYSCRNGKFDRFNEVKLAADLKKIIHLLFTRARYGARLLILTSL